MKVVTHIVSKTYHTTGLRKGVLGRTAA